MSATTTRKRTPLTAVTDLGSPRPDMPLSGLLEEDPSDVPAVGGSGSLEAFPLDGAGTYTPTPGARAAVFAAPGAKAVAVRTGRLSFAQDATHGTTATLAAETGWSYIYAGLGVASGSDREVKSGDVVGMVGQTPMTFVIVSPVGPVDPQPLFEELHQAPGQPGEPLPDLRVVPLPGQATPGQPAKLHAPAPEAEVPAPRGTVTRTSPAGGFDIRKVPMPILLLGAYVLLKKSGRGRRR